MGPLDAYICYRFVRLLTQPWDDTDAFKTGVIDGNGKLIADTNHLTPAQKKAYAIFDRLVYNIKRLIEKLPGGKSKLGTYAAAVYLFKEEMGDDEGKIVLERSFMTYLKESGALSDTYLQEQYKPEETLEKGHYKLLHDMLDTKGNSVHKGTIVTAAAAMKPISKVLGVDVYQLKTASGHLVIVSYEDIQDA